MANNALELQVRIAGPPPEVKIDSEPAHELTRFLNSGGAQPALLTPLFTRVHQQGLLPQPPMPQLPPQHALHPPPSSQAQQPQLPAATVAPQPPPDISNLLDSLKSAGLLSTLSKAASSPDVPSTAHHVPDSQRQDSPEPIPAASLAADEEIEREYNAPVNIKSFTRRVLQVCVFESIF